MLPIFAKAAENFCIHQIRSPYLFQEEPPKTRTLIAYIDISSDSGSQYRAYLGCDIPMIQSIAEIFLGEDESDDETLKDMLLETANMIIGSAKVLAAEAKDTSFTIGTPYMHDAEQFDADLGTFASILVGEGCLSVSLKEI